MNKLILIFALLLIIGCGQKLMKEVDSSYPDGTPMKENYYRYFGNTKELAKEIRYFTDGTIQSEGEFLQNKKHGKWTSWYDNGQKWMEENYSKDLKDGDFIVWYKSGIKNYEGSFSNGKPDGTWIFYDETGNKISKSKYEKGKKIKETRY
jgi:uncharacterized protein